MSFSDLFRKAPREAGRARPGASRLPPGPAADAGPARTVLGPEGPWDPSRRARARKKRVLLRDVDLAVPPCIEPPGAAQLI